MFHNKRYSVDPDNGGVEDYIKTTIMSCVSRSMLQSMELEPDRWSEAYKTFLLNIYCHLCELVNLEYVTLQYTYPEPIMFCRISKSRVQHIFYEPTIVRLFNGIVGSATCVVEKLPSLEVEVKQVKVLNRSLGNSSHIAPPLDEECIGDINLPTVSYHVFNKLLTLTVVADHAAGHFLLKSSDLEEDHRKMLQTPLTLSCLIRRAPDEMIQNQLMERKFPNLILKTYLKRGSNKYNNGDSSAESEDSDDSVGGYEEAE